MTFLVFNGSASQIFLLLFVGDSEDLTFQIRLSKEVLSSSALSLFFVLTGITFKCIFRQLSYDIFNATVNIQYICVNREPHMALHQCISL